MQESYLKLIILLPLLGAAIIGIGGFINEGFRKSETLIGWLGTAMVAIPFFIILSVFLGYHEEPVTFSVMDWINSGNLHANFGYSLDSLSLIMGLVVTGVGALIHLYSMSYMHGDSGFYKFFLYLNLFIFAMLNLILGDNMVAMFLGWEGVGACSFFLIGFWYQDMEKAKAAQKAFVANRIGDFFMLAAIFMIYHHVGSLDFASIKSADWSSYNAPTEWVALLIFLAATGKSAQIPLYVWLPDAMAGPTPVSALIHAATMVTSGIYLIARVGYIYVNAPSVMILVSVVGAMTAIVAALIAVTQNDIKKVLAYSTVSQLGFMFMALGAGAFTTAIFHVMTHAFFKACLFLGSGSVIHAMDHMHTVKDPQDIRTMGGLKKYMPITHITFLISTLAIAGIPGLSGFFSKDEILGKVFAAAGHGHYLYYLVYAVGITTALLTAFYMTRVYFLTFRGAERFPHDKHPHESPWQITVPLVVLGALALIGGFVGLPEIIGHGHYHFLNHFLESSVTMEASHHAEFFTELILIALSIAIAFSGVYLGWTLYSKHDLKGENKVKNFFGKMYQTMYNKYYVDEIYEMLIIHPFVVAGKDFVLWFDINIIDGFVNGTGKFTILVGDGIKRIQTGFVSHYALMVVVGMVGILGYLLFF